MKWFQKFLFLLVFFFVGIENVSAKTPTTYERGELEDYGVHKKWNITDTNKSNVLNTWAVDASEKIYDFSSVLTDEEYEELLSQVNAFIEKTGMDMAIVVDNVPYTSDSRNEEYAADFYDYNDFGIDFDHYSGVLFFRNTYENDPYYDIYTFGEAQLYFDYDRLQFVLDYVYNDIHEGRYYDGFEKFIRRLSSYYDSGIALKNYTLDENGFLKKKYIYPWIIFPISFVITLIIMLVLVARNRMVAKATRALEYLDKNSIHITGREDTFVSTHTTKYTESSSSGGSSGGSHSSSGSSGGGHSSGGGRHG